MQKYAFYKILGTFVDDGFVGRAQMKIVPEGKDARVVEEARLESVYTPKAYPGFESPSFRKGLELITRLKQINITNN